MFLIAFALYGATANRGAQWQDSGYHILRIVTQEPVNPLGLALSHPLHHWLGRFVVSLDLLEPCFAITLVSAFAGAIAVANTFGCVVTLTRKWPAALFAAMSLGFAHTFWQMATLTETYTLAAALLSGECWCLILYGKTRRPIYLWRALFLNGLGVSNHMLASLSTPILAAVALHGAWSKAIRMRDVAASAAIWLVGTLPYGLLVLNDYSATQDLWGTIRSALFGHGYGADVLNTTLSTRMLLISAAFVGLNFPNLLLPMAGYGLGIAWRCGVPLLVRRALLAGILIHAAFALRYPVVDQHTFFLPMYVILSIFAGIGFARILERVIRIPEINRAVPLGRASLLASRGSAGASPSRATVAQLITGIGMSGARRNLVAITAWVMIGLTPLLYTFLPDIARHWNVLASVERHKPYRDDYVYVFTPWSVVERSAERMSREAVALAGAEGIVVVEDRMAEFAVRYQALLADYDKRFGPERPFGGEPLRVEPLTAEGLQIVSSLPVESAVDALAANRPVVLVPANKESPRSEPPAGAWRRIGDLYLLVQMP